MAGILPGFAHNGIKARRGGSYSLCADADLLPSISTSREPVRLLAGLYCRIATARWEAYNWSALWQATTVKRSESLLWTILS
jgi:hypothetical protein